MKWNHWDPKKSTWMVLYKRYNIQLNVWCLSVLIREMEKGVFEKKVRENNYKPYVHLKNEKIFFVKKYSLRNINKWHDFWSLTFKRKNVLPFADLIQEYENTYKCVIRLLATHNSLAHFKVIILINVFKEGKIVLVF